MSAGSGRNCCVGSLRRIDSVLLRLFGLKRCHLLMGITSFSLQTGSVSAGLSTNQAGKGGGGKKGRRKETVCLFSLFKTLR